MPPEFPARIGPYDVIGAIGSGRLGTVYRAFHEAQARVVIVRVLSPALLADAVRLERFHREARALAAIDHPNLARTVDGGRQGDLVYTVTQYVDGCSLFDRLETSRLTLAEAIHVVREIAGGLGAAHVANVVHGDLNPRNVIVSRDLSVVKVADFGSGDPEIADASSGTAAFARSRIGSMLYRAPELARDQSTATVRSDIYSLGVIAYEAMTGKLPVGKFTLPSDANKQVPLELDPIVLKCLATDSAQRYENVAAFLADLDKVEAVVDYQLINELKRLSGGRLFTKKEAPKAARSTSSRTPLYLGLAAVAFIVVTAMAASLLRGCGSAGTGTDVAGAGRANQQPGQAATAPTGAPAPSGTPQMAAAQPTSSASSSTPPPAAQQPVAPPTGGVEPRKRPAPAPGRKQPEPLPARPDPEGAAQTLFNEAQALVRNRNDAEARTRLATIGQLYPQSSWFVPAMTVKISIEDRLHLKELDPVVGAVAPASIATRRLLTEHAPQHPTSEAAWWKLGEMYEDMKQYPLAVQAYAKLATRFPNTRYDAWFRAGEVSERRLNNPQEARLAYLKVPATSSRYEDAQNRARKLAK